MKRIYKKKNRQVKRKLKWIAWKNRLRKNKVNYNYKNINIGCSTCSNDHLQYFYVAKDYKFYCLKCKEWWGW